MNAGRLLTHCRDPRRESLSSFSLRLSQLPGQGGLSSPCHPEGRGDHFWEVHKFLQAEVGPPMLIPRSLPSCLGRNHATTPLLCNSSQSSRLPLYPVVGDVAFVPSGETNRWELVVKGKGVVIIDSLNRASKYQKVDKAKQSQ